MVTLVYELMSRLCMINFKVIMSFVVVFWGQFRSPTQIVMMRKDKYHFGLRLS